jgi:hypothetical protein
MLQVQAHLVLNSYVIQMNTSRIIIVCRVPLERLVEEVLPVVKILCVMYFYVETMNMP